MNMKLNLKYMFIASAAILAAVACNKEQRPDDGATLTQILLNATEAGTNRHLNKGTFPETKAMLDRTSFQRTGNRLKIYDYVDNSATAHIEDLIGPDVDGNTYGYEGVWPFVNGPHQWTPGVHKFFGWLDTDANFDPDLTAESFFGENFVFDPNNKTLTIPYTEMAATSTQFDFMYSNIISTEPKQGTVNLEFSHLFTAVSFGVENSTSSFVRIDDFKIVGIPSTRSATINFDGTATAVAYSNLTDATFTRGLDAGKYPYEISPDNLRSNIFNGSTTQEFMILWPIEAERLHSTEKTTTSDEGIVKYPEEWKMYIKYTADGQTYEKRINFPNRDLEAGKKYHFNIVFTDKMVELRTEVKPWEYEDQTIDYTTEGASLSAGGALAWDKNVSSVDDAAKMVSIVNAQPAQAMFTLQTPVGGSWIVSLVGDVNAFEVSPSTGIIDSKTATVYVRPLVSSPTRDYKVQLKFTVRRSDGRMIAADNVIQANGIYTVVLPRNN